MNIVYFCYQWFSVAKMQFMPCCVSARTCFFFFSHQKLSLWTAAAKFMLCVEIYSCCVLNYEWISSRWQLILIFVVSINILSCVSCIHGNVFVFVTGLSCFKCINNSIIQAMYTQWPLLVTPPPCKIQSEIWALNSAL